MYFFFIQTYVYEGISADAYYQWSTILILVMFCLLFYDHLPIFFIIQSSVSPMDPEILFTLSLKIPCKYSAIIIITIVMICICQAIDDKLTIQIPNSFFNTGNKSRWDEK